ncbi:MAG: NIL domain-containing protein, partial [Acutalibacteraceae bacterium]
NSNDTLPTNTGERTIRVVFNGAPATGAPLITQMAIDEKIAANIIYASTRCIGEKVHGNMLLGLPDDDETVVRAIKYLSKEDVFVEEVERDAE